jgi:hypothetical protein
MKKIIKFLLFVFISNAVFSFEIPKNLTHKNTEGFIENKGQILDQNGIPNAGVKYLLNGSGLNVQIRNTGFSYDTYTLEKKLKPTSERIEDKFSKKSAADSFNFIYHYHRVDIEFVNASKQPKIEANQASADFINYYNVPTSPEGILNVHSYKSVLVKDIYPGIDIEYLIDEEKGFKYNFIVHPGADYQLIQMKYLGAESNLVQNKIELSVAAGKLEEDIPLSWMKGDKNAPVNVEYRQIEKGVFGFFTNANLATNNTLIIDPIPSRLWGTYFGGSVSEFPGPCVADPTGAIYLSGWTSSGNNIATVGSHQSVYSGSNDAFLFKLNTNGGMQWATYYGGTGVEISYGCSRSSNGNIVLSGYTASTTNIATAGSHQAVFGAGTFDVFIAVFNANGVRQWATYYGGSGDDGYGNNEVDPSGNIILSGITNSSNGISTVGAHQAAFSGDYDAFIVKFNSSGTRLWGSYYGGFAREEYTNCTIDNSGNTFLSGITNSGSNIATTGAHQSAKIDTFNFFLVKFNSSGIRQWGTYFGKSSELTFADCSTDAIGNVFLCGTTNSINNISTVGAYQMANAGNYDGFLVKFNTSGVRQWGTYFGGTGFESDITSKVDSLGNIFLSGSTGSVTQIATIGSYQETISGAYDAFLVKFNSSGNRIWGTYYGGTSWEEEIFTSNISNGIIYLCGYTSSASGIATVGAHQAARGGFEDAFIVKFTDASTGVLGPIGTIVPVGGATACNQTAKSYTLSAVVTNAIGYQWTIPAGWVIQSGQGTLTLTVIPNSTGAISVKGYNSIGDSTAAAALAVTVIVVAQPSAISGLPLNCLGTATTYSVTAVSGTTYSWLPLPTGWTGSSTTNSISVTPNAITTSDTIRVTANKSGCASISSKYAVGTTRIPLTPTNFSGNNPACKLLPSNFTVDSFLYTASYTWTFPSGWTINSGSSSRIINVTPSASAIAGNITVRGTNYCGNGPILTIATSLPSTAPTIPSIITGSTTICSGLTQTYSVTNVAGTKYRWVLPNDWSINSGQTTNLISVTVGPTAGNVSVYPSFAASPTCEGTPRTLAVNVSATPVAPAQIIGETDVCTNSSYSFTTPIIPNALTYTWTLPAGFTLVSGATTNTIGVNTGSSLGSALVLSVKANNGACSSANFNLNITGNIGNIPSQPGVISGNASLCANSNQTYSIVTIPNATSYTWTLPPGWVFNGNSIGNSVNVIAGSQEGNITVAAKNGSCKSLATTFTVTNVKMAPTQPGSIGFSGTICGGKQTAFTIAAVSGATAYIWTLPSGWSGASTTTTINVTPSSNSDTLIVVASNGSCNSAPSKLGLIVNQTPAQPAPITGNNLVCINAIYNFIIARQTGVSNYTWSVPGSWSVISGGNDTFLRATPNTLGVGGNVSVVANNNGCASIPRTIATTVNTNLPATPGAIVGSSIVCDGVVNDFSISSVTNALNYTWTIPTGWTFTSGQSTTSIKVVPNNTNGQITVKAINGACVSAERVLAISTVVPPPAQPVISGNTNPCINSNATFTVAAVPGAISYLWTSPVGWTMSAPTGQGTNILIAGQTGVINVSANNGYCKGIAATLTIDASQLPNITSWEGEQYVKSFTIRKYKAPSLANTSYIWTVPSDWTIMSGSTQNEISVLIGQSSGVITVRGTNDCGTGASYSKNVYTGVAAGMDKELLLSNIKIFPQPANDQFTLSFMPLVDLEDVTIRISDLLGKTLSNTTVGNIASGKANEMNFSSVEMISGIYLLSIESKQTTKTYKISINH